MEKVCTYLYVPVSNMYVESYITSCERTLVSKASNGFTFDEKDAREFDKNYCQYCGGLIVIKK